MTINTKAKTAVERDSHMNFMGGPSFDVTNPLARLRMAASSCFFGEPNYYQRDGAAKRRPIDDTMIRHLHATLESVDPREWRSLSPAAALESAIDAALAADGEATLEEAARLRNEDHIRATPQVILVRAANAKALKGTGLIRKYAPRIIRRVDDATTGLAYQLAVYGKDAPIPNALKASWADALERFNEYQLAKYRMESREVKLVDLVNLCRPKGEAINKLVRGKLKNTGQTWEAILSQEGSTEEAWTKALDVMGHMALLRNVRNLLEKKVPLRLFLDKLVEGAPTGQQLPFRYFSAYKAIGDGAPGAVKDAIEKCLEISLGNLPKFPGRVMSLCDNSGSARKTTTSKMGTMLVSEIANLTAILTARRADDGYVGVFGDRLEVLSVRQRAAIFDQLDHANAVGDRIGHGTENGIWLFWDKAIREKQHWDHVFVFSDMQAGHGGLYGLNRNDYSSYLWPGSDGHPYIDVGKLIRQYRSKVNPNVNVFLVQVAGYQDTLLPEYYKRTYILGGWSEGLLRFAAQMSGLDAAVPPPQQ